MGEEPSCSNVSALPEEMETDLPQTGSISRYRFPCPNCLEMSYGLEIITSDISYFGNNLRSVIAESEILIKDYLKRQRLERKASTTQKNKMFNVDEESSLSGSEDDLLLAKKEVSDNCTKQRTYGRSSNAEKRTFGSWLILSFVTGGWNYSTVKNFLLNEYGVKCSRSRTTPERLAMAGVFKAIVKFENREELKQVVMSLKESQIHDKFLFLSFDKRSVNQEFSESDSDDGSTGYLVPISKGT
ncbi:uncharacterized protein LOC126780566 [Nymphalis io]|uniref:uncharacterized protein LOC126780566 n=1 Tax=Inachis io TaxID=171585 RepID=UPI002169198B|nr:uncharacterized protein LOC126780566 [Nymphalis io]